MTSAWTPGSRVASARPGATGTNVAAGKVAMVSQPGPTGPQGPVGPAGPQGPVGDPGITVSSTPPANPQLNQLWLQI
jgi:hypothetical protein